MPDIPGNHDDWRVTIDSDVKNLGERMAGVETGMESLGRNFDRFTHAFEASDNRQAELAKTRWPVVLGVLSIITVVLSGFLSGYLRDLNRVEENVKTIQSKRVSAQDPAQNLQITELQRRVTEAEHSSETHRLVDIKQGAKNTVRIKDLEGEVLSMRREEHNILKTRGALTERIRAMERQVFGKPGGGVHDVESGHLHGSTD